MAEEVVKKGFKAFLDNAKGYIAGVMAIVSVASVIYAAGIKAERKDSSNTTVVTNQVVMLDSIASFSKQIRSVKVDLGSVMEKQVEAKVAYNSLRLVVLDMASKAPGMTIEQILNYVNSVPELKKKNFTNQIPYKNENLILTLK